MLFSSYVQTLFPKVLGNTADILGEKGFNPAVVYTNLYYILLIAIGTFAFTYLWRNLVIGNARKLECQLREKLFEHFQQLSPEFYTQEKTGDLIAYAINDINAVRRTLGPAASMSINGIVVCILSIYSMANTIDWRLTLLSLLPMPLIVYIMYVIGKAVKRRFKKVQETFASISDRVNENINGIRVIKSYVQESKEVENFSKLNDRMVEANMDMVRVSASLSPLIELCFTMSFVMNLIYGGNMVLKGMISLGDFVAFNGYLAMILAPVLSIGKVITIFQRGFASLDRLNGILDIKPQIEDNGTVKTFPSSGSVKIQDLSFTYPGTQKKTLDDINIEIPEGHTLGIIGKTGSGKSTLANLLLKTFNVEDNKIFIGDTDINELKLNTLRGGFGYVPQDNFLFKASIIDNISFFEATYSDTDIEEAAKHSCIYQDIIMMPDGFETKVGERGVNLSGGQKQRISIARALVRNPEILILDDALSAVDTVTETKILHNLQEVRKGKTTIVIASRISTIMEADEIIVFDKGRICERGTHEQLLGKGGLYREIYDYQFSNETYLS
ncbi:MAG: ABC transporter ATP-binding protein/permease [Spirochaetia bacterium]|nr:ABC transporter ATP-binding protein/permease [Spirochaetia bacterium]